jgi:hypothetical protein
MQQATIVETSGYGKLLGRCSHFVEKGSVLQRNRAEWTADGNRVADDQEVCQSIERVDVDKTMPAVSKSVKKENTWNTGSEQEIDDQKIGHGSAEERASGLGCSIGKEW